jgi:sialate O-acetylesterase
MPTSPSTLVNSFVARLLAGGLSIFPSAVKADVWLPAIFSDHLVMQKAEVVPVWGKADPGEHILVTAGDKSAEATADESGRWKTQLNLKDSAPGPFEMTVEGKKRIVIHDVLVGEVWLASGQSNMELPLRVTTGAAKEIAQSANPNLRQFLVKKAGSKLPQDDCQGQWTVAGPESSGEFTAVGYYFGKELQQARKCPVGIIHSSHGGTYIEPWTPADCFDRVPSFKAAADALRQRADDYPKQKVKFATGFAAWLKQSGREDERHPDVSRYADEHASTENWKSVSLPGKVPNFASGGVYWLRRDVDVPEQVARQGFKVMIGPLSGCWQVYWNGRKIDEMSYAELPGKNFPCYFPVPVGDIRTGRNTLAIRIFSPVSPLAVLGGSLWAGPIDLNGRWLAKAERSFPELSPEAMGSAPKMDYEQPDMLPGALYNGMIHPL